MLVLHGFKDLNQNFVYSYIINLKYQNNKKNHNARIKYCSFSSSVKFTSFLIIFGWAWRKWPLLTVRLKRLILNFPK